MTPVVWGQRRTIRCPRCGGETGTRNTRTIRHGRVVYRQRYCRGCAFRFATHEALEVCPPCAVALLHLGRRLQEVRPFARSLCGRCGGRLDLDAVAFRQVG